MCKRNSSIAQYTAFINKEAPCYKQWFKAWKFLMFKDRLKLYFNQNKIKDG